MLSKRRVKGICLDSLNPNNENNNSLFSSTKSNCFLNIMKIFQVLSIYKGLMYKDKKRGMHLHDGKQ